MIDRWFIYGIEDGVQFSQVCQLLGMPLDRYQLDRFASQLKVGLHSYAVLQKTVGKKSQLNKFLNANWKTNQILHGC